MNIVTSFKKLFSEQDKDKNIPSLWDVEGVFRVKHKPRYPW
jgi:hypothetical protein